jgi:hypothetical protein
MYILQSEVGTAMDVTIRSSPVAARRRRRSLEDRLPLLSSRSAMTLRKPLRLQPLRQAPLSRLYHETFSHEALTSMVHLEKVLWRSYVSYLSELPCARTEALALHYGGSFGSSATTYGPIKLLLHWHDNRQRLPIRRLLSLLECSYCCSLTVSRKQEKRLQIELGVCHVQYLQAPLLQRSMDCSVLCAAGKWTSGACMLRYSGHSSYLCDKQAVRTGVLSGASRPGILGHRQGLPSVRVIRPSFYLRDGGRATVPQQAKILVAMASLGILVQKEDLQAKRLSYVLILSEAG